MSQVDMSDPTPQKTLEEHISYALLRVAARLALNTQISLKEIKKLVELAYYHEARNRGLKMREISSILSVSMAKVGLLSKGLKQHFIEPELKHGISRQILALLWAGPLSETRIVEALDSFEREEITDALDQLLELERIETIEGLTSKFGLTAAAHRLDRQHWMAKVDGLNTLLEFVGKTVEARFFKDDDRASVRNLSFRVRPEDLEKLQQFYETQLFPLVVELDNAVDKNQDSLPIKLSMLWTVDGEEGE